MRLITEDLTEWLAYTRYRFNQRVVFVMSSPPKEPGNAAPKLKLAGGDWFRQEQTIAPVGEKPISVAIYSFAAAQAPLQALEAIAMDPLPVFAFVHEWSRTLEDDLRGAGAVACFGPSRSPDEAAPTMARLLEPRRYVTHYDDKLEPFAADDRTLRWHYDSGDDTVRVSPALAALLDAKAGDSWGGMETFFIELAGLSARDLLAACRLAVDAQDAVHVVHRAAQRIMSATLSPYLEHRICVPSQGGNDALKLFATVKPDVSQRHVETLHQSPGVLTEAGLKASLSGYLRNPPKQTGLSAAVCIVSLDRFEQMNILLGRQIADELLDQVALRLRKRLLDFAAQRDDGDARAIELCRIGGAQFALAMEGALHINEAHALADYVLECFAEPFVMLNQRLHLSARIGIAAARATERLPDKVISRAALALSVALRDPPGSYRVFDAHDAALAQEKVILDGELRDALSQDSLFIQYMPIIDLGARRVNGFEALVRWNHPEMGLLTPGLFIPMAEESGAIADVGDWVLSRALYEFSDLCRALPSDVHLSVNISPEQFRRSDLTATVLQQLATTGLSERRLILEVTESLVIEDFKRAKDVMDALRARGVRWSIDDFGTGFSALSYLSELPFDELKLDKKFVRALADSSDETIPRTLIEAVLSIARSHNALTVAEGIETAGQAEWVTQLGCDLGQGYYFAAPMEAGKIPAFVEQFNGLS